MPTIAKGANALHGITLSANTTLVVEIQNAWPGVQVVVLTSSAPIYYTVDESDPATTAGAYIIPGGVVASDTREFRNERDAVRVVKLRSAAAASLSVQRTD